MQTAIKLKRPITSISLDLDEASFDGYGLMRWIPVTERLPKNDDFVVVTIQDESGDNPYTYSDFGWYLDKADCWIVDANQRTDITAWMPLPEPYAERGEPSAELNNGIGCSRCGERLGCYDRNMSHAVLCNNYGKITDAERSE